MVVSSSNTLSYFNQNQLYLLSKPSAVLASIKVSFVTKQCHNRWLNKIKTSVDTARQHRQTLNLNQRFDGPSDWLRNQRKKFQHRWPKIFLYLKKIFSLHLRNIIRSPSNNSILSDPLLKFFSFFSYFFPISCGIRQICVQQRKWFLEKLARERESEMMMKCKKKERMLWSERREEKWGSEQSGVTTALAFCTPPPTSR